VIRQTVQYSPAPAQRRCLWLCRRDVWVEARFGSLVGGRRRAIAEELDGRPLHHRARCRASRGRVLLVLWKVRHGISHNTLRCSLHLLKLVMGVDISTRLPRRTGSEGKSRKRRRRSRAAPPYSSSLEASMVITSYSISSSSASSQVQVD
jgi:hypothetical protein